MGKAKVIINDKFIKFIKSINDIKQLSLYMESVNEILDNERKYPMLSETVRKKYMKKRVIIYIHAMNLLEKERQRILLIDKAIKERENNE